MYVHKIMKYRSFRFQDVELMRHRSHVLHTLLEGFVLRRGHEILRSTLPPKYEHVLFLRPSPVQGALYSFTMDNIKNNQGTSSAGPLKAFALCSKVQRGKGWCQLLWCMRNVLCCLIPRFGTILTSTITNSRFRNLLKSVPFHSKYIYT